MATSFNGIWKGCEEALIEAGRVVRPGGLVGFTFWGSPRHTGLLPYFATLVELSPADHIDATPARVIPGGRGDCGRANSAVLPCGVGAQLRPVAKRAPVPSRAAGGRAS